MSKDDVKVEVTDELITIEGERKAEARDEKEGYFYSERSYGHFFRSIPMPEGAESEKARATFQGGVLEVTMPVPEQPSRKPKRIEIAEKS
jgi:HSP20 family protein